MGIFILETDSFNIYRSMYQPDGGDGGRRYVDFFIVKIIGDYEGSQPGVGGMQSAGGDYPMNEASKE